MTGKKKKGGGGEKKRMEKYKQEIPAEAFFSMRGIECHVDCSVCVLTGCIMYLTQHLSRELCRVFFWSIC